MRIHLGKTLVVLFVSEKNDEFTQIAFCEKFTLKKCNQAKIKIRFLLIEINIFIFADYVSIAIVFVKARKTHEKPLLNFYF